mmetsp:Transcript_35990/g.81694  ORF Transcript_35990/g.81694 Transcript_35990/m.81694 type:complete len:83 (+) Transcript_35990:378-626(+)
MYGMQAHGGVAAGTCGDVAARVCWNGRRDRVPSSSLLNGQALRLAKAPSGAAHTIIAKWLCNPRCGCDRGLRAAPLACIEFL